MLIIANNTELLKRLYNAFDPFRPLPAGDPTYVDLNYQLHPKYLQKNHPV
jgi:hypothetical protein